MMQGHYDKGQSIISIVLPLPSSPTLKEYKPRRRYSECIPPSHLLHMASPATAATDDYGVTVVTTKAVVWLLADPNTAGKGGDGGDYRETEYVFV